MIVFTVYSIVRIMHIYSLYFFVSEKRVSSSHNGGSNLASGVQIGLG